MISFGDVRIHPVPAQPWVLYDVVTGHGSQLCVYFKHDKDFIHPETGEVICRGGDMHITGYSASQSAPVDFWGLGFEPEVHSNIAVAILGQRSDGTHVLAEELIVEIIDKTLIGHPPTEE